MPYLETVNDLLYKLHCQWPFEAEAAAGKRNAMEIFVREVGEIRACEAVSQAIQHHSGKFCPSIGVIRGYLPEPKQPYIDPEELAQLKKERAVHPEDFFGTADMICCLRAQAKRAGENKPLYTFDALMNLVELARKKYGYAYTEKFRTAPQPARDYQGWAEESDL